MVLQCYRSKPGFRYDSYYLRQANLVTRLLSPLPATGACSRDNTLGTRLTTGNFPGVARASFFQKDRRLPLKVNIQFKVNKV